MKAWGVVDCSEEAPETTKCVCHYAHCLIEERLLELQLPAMDDVRALSEPLI
jgi:hypothetical protein